jgi:hypothetical protein
MGPTHSYYMADQPIVATTAYRGHRSKLSVEWHYCARCGSRVAIQEMVWQRGLLLCKRWDCVDYGNHGNFLIGQREANIAQVLSIPSKELMPNDKLVTPLESGSNTEDDIIF